MFYKIKHNLKIKKIKRELELKKLLCNHYYGYYGNSKLESYNGIEVDFEEIYVLKCLKCNKTIRYYNKNEVLNFIEFQNEKIKFKNKGRLNNE